MTRRHGLAAAVAACALGGLAAAPGASALTEISEGLTNDGHTVLLVFDGNQGEPELSARHDLEIRTAGGTPEHPTTVAVTDRTSIIDAFTLAAPGCVVLGLHHAWCRAIQGDFESGFVFTAIRDDSVTIAADSQPMASLVVDCSDGDDRASAPTWVGVAANCETVTRP